MRRTTCRLVWFDLSILFQLSLRPGKQNMLGQRGTRQREGFEPNPAADWFGFLLSRQGATQSRAAQNMTRSRWWWLVVVVGLCRLLLRSSRTLSLSLSLSPASLLFLMVQLTFTSRADTAPSHDGTTHSRFLPG